jgi:drug/metabolite transporter (DMT)-like permease
MMSKKSFFSGFGAILIWSTTFALSKFVLENGKSPNHFNVFTYLAIRFSFSLVYLWSALFVSKKVKNVPLILKAKWKLLLFLGLISFAGSYVVQYFGILGTTSINQSIILEVQVFFVFFISALIYKNKISPFVYFGAVVAFSGLIFIIANTGGAFAINKETIYGDLMSLLTAFLWATFSAVSAELVTKYDRLIVLTLVETIASVVIIPLAFLKMPNSTNNLAVLSGWDWLALVWLGIICTGIGYQLWYKSLSDSKSQDVILLMYIMPIFSYIVGYLLLGELINWKMLIGSILIIGGLLIAQFIHPRKKKNEKDENEIISLDSDIPKP